MEGTMYKLIDNTLLDNLTKQASDSPRLRINKNFHTELIDPIQRLCNAFEPQTYVRPHRHCELGKWELFVILRGSIAVLVFNETGAIEKRVILSDQGPVRGIEIAENQCHTLVSLQSGTVVFEIKPGPYQTMSDKDFAPWAPKEGDGSVPLFLDWFKRGEINSRPPLQD